MAQMSDMLMFMLSYLIIIVGGFLLINFLSNGFLGKFLLVKASRGRKKLVRCFDASDSYFAIGTVNSGYLRFANREKNKRRLNVRHGYFQRILGVDEIAVDMVSDNIIMPNGELTTGLDAEKNENLIVRALTKPTLTSKKDQAKFAMIVIIGLVAIGYIAYNIMGISDQIAALTKMITELKSAGVVQ